MITITLRPNVFRTSLLPEKPDYTIVNWRISARPTAWRPPTDVYELENQIVVRLEIAGMKDKDFQITLEQNILIIQGTRPDISDRRSSFHQMEINFGEFISAVEIFTPIDTQTVSAEYSNGFLWVNLPKASPKQIPNPE